MNKQLEVNDVVGGYRLDGVIGQGGMGCVYRATHARLGRRAAVKVLANNLAADEEYVSRFFHEARIVNDIGHANIIDIIDFVETAEPRCVAYIMELVDGPSLGGVLKTHTLSVRQAANIALQLTDALRAVHAQSVVHRDLKPDNVLIIGPLDTDLSAVPAIKVLDFGIAKIDNNNGGHKTSTGMILGTPAYMAPEQVAAEPVSPATDIYAIAEILYEMLSGRRVFIGENMQVLRAKLVGDVPELPYPEGMPLKAQFAALIRECLVQEPSKRPPTEHVIAALKQIIAELPPGPERKMDSQITSRRVATSTPTGAKAIDPQALSAVRSQETRAQKEHLQVNDRTPSHFSSASAVMLAPPEVKSSSKTMVFGIAGAVVALALGAGIFFKSNTEQAVIEEQVVEKVAPPPVQVAPKFVVHVSSTPAGAEVIDPVTSRVLGTAPIDVEIAEGTDLKKIELRLAEHETKAVELRRGEANAAIAMVAVPAPAPVEEEPKRTHGVRKVAAKKVEELPKEPETKKKGSGPLKKSEVGEW